MNSFYQEIAKNGQSLLILPQKKDIHQFIEDLFSVLFSNTSKSFGHLPIIEHKFEVLEKEFNEIVRNYTSDKNASFKQSITFFEALPELYRKTLNDAET